MSDKSSAFSRVVGVEEHFNVPSLVPQIPEGAATARGFLSRDAPFGRASMLDKLADTDGRLKVLDAAGLTVQVLSLAGPGADLLPPAEGVRWAQEANNALAEKIAAHPTRYAGFAHLPLTDPDASADELERTVRALGFKGALISGATDGRYLDDPAYEPLLARAETLDVPIYVHPAPSPQAARDALYGGLPDELGFWLSISGWGWHADTAVHILRLMLSGALQRHPGLKLIIGHLGEGLQILMQRLDQQFHQFAGFDGVPSEILRRQVWVSFGGFFMLPSFLATLDAFGIDRILYSVDYPFGAPERGRAFLESLPLEPEDLAKVTHRNADHLLKLAV